MYQHLGQCPCGSVTMQFSSPQDISHCTSRKCDCQYCLDRGIEYLSDPQGQITISSLSPLQEEKQGSEQATFLLCPSCQIVVGVGYTGKGFSVGSLNATLLDEYEKLQGRLVVSPKTLDKTNKVKRWRELWSEMLLVVKC